MKKVLVYGLGITGISTVKTLASKGYKVYTFDKLKKEDDRLKGYDYSPISDVEKEDKFDFVVKSPGIKPDDEIVKVLEKNNEIISDIELSYRIFNNKEFLAVTGTNGKTTTTSLISHILNESGKRAIAVGNIGEGILWQMYKNEAVFVEEVSSFQLHNTKFYKPHIGIILNITPDHIDWHKSEENYIKDKLSIARNQDQKDYIIINHDDKILSKNKENFNANIYEFSTKEKISNGIYLDGDDIVLNIDEPIKLFSRNDLKIVGNHNISNAMAAVLALYLYGIDINEIVKYIKTFKAISHRLEFVTEINNVKFFDDSKATNVDSAIKALESFDKNVILIAGGYDKNIDYRPLFESSSKKIKAIILIGQTKNILKSVSEDYGIKYFIEDTMKDAVDRAFMIMKKNDIVLLSPASASWDMYKSFEERGNDFKNLVKEREPR
ncbi:UDP-N-acetylmuramoyl-L-alanine--D-glutamate ligase [Anaerococcus porci]|uniref:UDP-N-acetylmuramoyl-L-alanine--D-glutamate ligase n=1 Tax=Anaerococcus porci TaxID=2652269 RepID=UPI002A74A967|nr:UDP-N-acetylmuramoyl-L-alanine--D-glutamate ligase [Anaerococcus porci]MDY3005515.1 UDP-N-acetylmuramoyl-L-alanine--D-glutamate ligase [Anaerococcus porci]